MEILSGLLRSTLQRALFAAQDRQHAFLEPAHLLQALIDDEDARAALTGCGADLGQLHREITPHLDQLPIVAESAIMQDPSMAMATEQALREIITRMKRSGRSTMTMTGADVLLSIASHPDWAATRILHSQELDRTKIQAFFRLWNPSSCLIVGDLRLPTIVSPGLTTPLVCKTPLPAVSVSSWPREWYTAAQGKISYFAGRRFYVWADRQYGRTRRSKLADWMSFMRQRNAPEADCTPSQRTRYSFSS